MADLQSAAIPDPARSIGPWRFWATLGWTVAVLLAWVAAQLIVFAVAVVYASAGGEMSSAEVYKLASHAIVISLVAIVSIPAEMGVVALAIRFARGRFADYLGLVRPSGKYLLIGLACLAVVLPLADFAT